MNRISIGLALVITLISGVGCSRIGPAIQVVTDRAEDALINQIGALDVQRQEVVNAVAKAKEEIGRLQRVEAENAVEAETLASELELLSQENEDARLEMLQLADYIERSEPLTLSDGTVVTVADLQGYAERKISAYETLSNKMAIKQQTFDLYTQNVKTAHEHWVEGKQIVDELEGQLELIDAQIAALKVYQEQPQLLTEGGTFESAITDAKTLVDGTHKTLTKELRIREKMGEVVETDLDAKIEAELQKATASESGGDIVSKLRNLASDTGE